MFLLGSCWFDTLSGEIQNHPFSRTQHWMSSYSNVIISYDQFAINHCLFGCGCTGSFDLQLSLKRLINATFKQLQIYWPEGQQRGKREEKTLSSSVMIV